MSKILQDAAESLREAQAFAEALEHIFGDIQDELERGNEATAGMLADIGRNTCEAWQQIHAEAAYTLEQILERMEDGEVLVSDEADFHETTEQYRKDPELHLKIDPIDDPEGKLKKSVGDAINEVFRRRAEREE